jgi:steroid 5-alpha reductase family enzyme
MKWNTSSSSVAVRFSSDTNGSGLAKLLCAVRMLSLLLIAIPVHIAGVGTKKQRCWWDLFAAAAWM